MYTLRHAKIWYGSRSIPMDNVVLPETIESADDLDLDNIAEQLNRYVFKYGNPKSWNLEIDGTSPEKAAELNKELKADPKFAHLDGFVPTICVGGRGISIVYDGSAS